MPQTRAFRIPGNRKLRSLLLACLLLSLSAAPAQGQLQGQERTLDSSVQVETGIARDSAKSQQRVSSLARQTQDLLSEFRAVVRETEALRIYNDNLERLVVDQRDEIQSINRQLIGLEDTNRGVVPLMLEMIETLVYYPHLRRYVCVPKGSLRELFSFTIYCTRAITNP